MITMIITLFILLGVVGILGEAYLLSLWIIAQKKTKKKKFSSFSPTASIIIPCKGIDHGFQQNIQAFLTQQYDHYTTIFVVDTKEDPAYTTLVNLVHDNPLAQIVLTKPCSGCSGKIAALLTGLEHSSTAEVLVFADSDIQPHQTWLLHLITPLQDESIGVTTGYRWYFPTDKKTLLISTWNMAPIVFMFYPNYTFAWGGSTAIRKTLFDTLDIATKWKTEFSDDLVVTTTIKKANYKIYLEPKCIMESPPETSIAHFLRWGTRQYTWVRWYNPWFWFGSFIGFIGVQLVILIGILCLLLGYYLPGVLMSSLLFFEILYGGLGISTLQKTMVYPKQQYHSKIGYALMTPLVFLLIAYNVFASSLKREIEWAGRTYKKPKKTG
jgi:ceramide glucosyltransferase